MTKNLVKKTEFGINLKKYSYYLQEGPLGSDVFRYGIRTPLTVNRYWYQVLDLCRVTSECNLYWIPRVQECLDTTRQTDHIFCREYV